jgi:hypothetical protein
MAAADVSAFPNTARHRLATRSPRRESEMDSGALVRARWQGDGSRNSAATRLRRGEERMPKLSRRRLMLGTAALAAPTFAVRRARAAEYTYKYANNLPLAHPMNQRAQEAAARIKEETGGRFELQIFPSSQPPRPPWRGA